MKADVQLEHGHVRIANRLYEAMLDADFTGTQMRILVALIRLTYGWRRKTVTLSVPELAQFTRLTPVGGFRRALHELVEEGVLLRLVDGGGPSRATYAIQKDFTQWGRYAIAPARLESLWGTRPAAADALMPTKAKGDPGGTPGGLPPKGIPLQGHTPAGSEGVTPQGEGVRPSGDTGTGSNCDTPPQLGARKDSERQGKTVSTSAGDAAVISAEKKETWLTPFFIAWLTRYGGDMPVGPSVRPLKRLVQKHGTPEVLRRWVVYLEATEGAYANAARFAATWGEWSGAPRKPQSTETIARAQAEDRWAFYVRKGLTNHPSRSYVEEIAAEEVKAGRCPSVEAFVAELRVTQPWTLKEARTDGWAIEQIAQRLSQPRIVA